MPTTTQDDDTDSLIARATGGDGGAMDCLLVRHRAKLRRMVQFRMDRRARGRFDPSDVVQETLIEAARQMERYLEQPRIGFYPWLRSIAWQRLIDFHRRHLLARRRSVERELDRQLNDESALHLANHLVDSATGPAKGLAKAEQHARVRRAMAMLSTQAREVLMLRFVEQLSTRDAAQIMGLTESAFKGRQVRALEKLRSLLADDDPTGMNTRRGSST